MGHRAEYPTGCIFVHGSHRVRHIEKSVQLSRRSACTGADLSNARPHQIAGLHHQKLRPVQTADAVAERTVASGFGVIIGDSPDPRDMVAYQNADPVAGRRFFRRDKKLRFPSAAFHPHDNRLAFLNASEQCLRAVCFLSVHRNDHIALPDPCLLRRCAALYLRDHQSLRIELDADCISARNQRASGCGSLAAQRKRKNERGQRGRYFSIKNVPPHVLILSAKVSAPLS